MEQAAVVVQKEWRFLIGIKIKMEHAWLWGFISKPAKMMDIERRGFILGLGVSVLAIAGPTFAQTKGDLKMYGLIGKMTAVPGKRDALIAILLEGVSGMPGCLSYVVAKDTADSNAIWITEVWDSQESHKASIRCHRFKKQ